MESSDVSYASEKLIQLKSEYHVDVVADWGMGSDGAWHQGTWSKEELDRLHRSIGLLAGIMKGANHFVENLGGVVVVKEDIGLFGGQAQAHLVKFNSKSSFSAWTVVHEFAHAWDANFNWKLSIALEKYTGGSTRPWLSWLKKLIGLSDSKFFKHENKPGKRGRKPGCNAAGYFYGDKPSGSNWKFNRLEDFAESVAMYIGWARSNDLSKWAEARIKRYLLDDGASDKNFGADYWKYYSKFFYPASGDYTKTKRWKFVEELVKGRITIA